MAYCEVPTCSVETHHTTSKPPKTKHNQEVLVTTYIQESEHGCKKTQSSKALTQLKVSLIVGSTVTSDKLPKVRLIENRRLSPNLVFSSHDVCCFVGFHLSKEPVKLHAFGCSIAALDEARPSIHVHQALVVIVINGGTEEPNVKLLSAGVVHILKETPHPEVNKLFGDTFCIQMAALDFWTIPHPELYMSKQMLNNAINEACSCAVFEYLLGIYGLIYIHLICTFILLSRLNR